MKVTPTVLRDWYGVSPNIVAKNTDSRQSVYAELQRFDASYLQQFCSQFGLPQQNCSIEKVAQPSQRYNIYNPFFQRLLAMSALNVRREKPIWTFNTSWPWPLALRYELPRLMSLSLKPINYQTWFWEVLKDWSDLTHGVPWILNWGWEVNNQTIPNMQAPLVHSIRYADSVVS
mgnify:CR=1 FL=1